MSTRIQPSDRGAEAPRLDTLHFSSTKSCNLGCAFCYDNAVRGPTENLPLEVIARFAGEAADLGCRRVILSGGEPTLRKDWREVSRIFDDLDMEVSLATNGTRISDEVAQFLGSLKHCTLSISLDGGEEVHDLLRGARRAYRRTLRGLQSLQTAGVSFDLNATISRTNLSEVAQLTRISRDFSCKVRLSLLHPNGRGEDMYDTALNPDEVLRLREYCHLMRKGGVQVYVNLPPLLQYLDEVIPGRGAACGWAENFCGVLANGDVSICGVAVDEPTLVAGNVKRDSFAEIWRKASLFRHTRSLKTADIRGICGRCPFNAMCGGACRLSAYREDGDFLAPYALCQHFYDQGYIPEQLLEPAQGDPAAG